LHSSVAERIFGLASRVGIEPEIALTGGVAKNQGMIRALEEKVGRKILIPIEPQIIGAFGAGLLAKEKTIGK